MSDKKLNSRQSQILLYCRIGQSYAISQISELIATKQKVASSAPTLRRDMVTLCDLGFFKQIGSRKSTKYVLNSSKIIFAPIDAHQYCQLDIDRRPGNNSFNFELFADLPSSLFNRAELLRLYSATEK